MNSKEIIQKRKERFENYIREYYSEDYDVDGDSLFDWTGLTYSWHWVREYWNTYNAALDSVVVELPQNIERSDTGLASLVTTSYNTVLDHCRDAIHAAGVKTK